MYMLVHSVVISKHTGEPLVRMDHMVHFRYNFGTTEREKNGTLFPKRHQIKHLEFVLS
jgi:hypothetical protein